MSQTGKVHGDLVHIERSSESIVRSSCAAARHAKAFFRAIKLDYRDAQLLFDLLDSDQSGKASP